MDCVSLPKCFILQTPGFLVFLNVRKKKQNAWITVSKRPGYVTSSLSITQTDKSTPSKEETEFKSSFDEYLKAMESIRADREKNKGHKEGSGHRKKLKDVAFTKNAPKNPRPEKSRMFKRSKVPNFDAKDELYEGFDVVADKARSRGCVQERVAVSSQKEPNYSVSKDASSKSSYSDTRDVTSSKRVWKKKVQMDEMASENDLEMERRKSSYVDIRDVTNSKHVWKKSATKDKMTCENDLEMERCKSSNVDMRDVTSSKYIWKKSATEDKITSDNDLEMKRRKSSYVDISDVTSSRHVWKKSTTKDKMTSENNYEMERFVFQSSELQNDVHDGRRVTQMEMEERIKKLAKCLNEAVAEMPEWMFSKMMRSAKIRFSDHSMMRIIQILGKLGNWRMVLQVVEWLQRQERFKSHKIRNVYTVALGELGKTRRPVEALNLFSAMKRYRSSYPDIVAYHSIAVTLGQAGHMKELFDVIDGMRLLPTNFNIEDFEDWDPRLEPDIVVYNAVLNACVKRKEWAGAFWILQKLEEIDQRPSSTTYGLLMEVMLASGKYDLVHEFFRQLQASSAPNALTYRVLVNTLWREGKPEAAIAAVQEMESRGLVSSASVYYDLARCLCSAGRCEEALMQVEKICKVASKPLLVTYTGLMQACLDSGNIEDGTFIFKHMQKYCSPNLVTYNVLLKAYLGRGMFTEAKALFQKMTQSGQQGSTINGHITPDIHTFDLMLEACIKGNKWDDFEHAYDQMLQHGYPFNTKRHLWMVLQASKAGKAESVETTWKHLMKSGRVPPPALVKERFRLKMENDDLVAAISSVASHPSSHQQSFSKDAWSKFLDDNSHCFNKETLKHLVSKINVSMSNSESPNLIYKNLRDSCEEFVGQDESVSRRTHLTETHVDV